MLKEMLRPIERYFKYGKKHPFWLGIWEFEHRDKDGNLIERWIKENALGDPGEQLMLDVFLRDSILSKELAPALADADWTGTDGWSEADGHLVKAAGSGTGTETPTGDFPVVAGKTYKIKMTVSALSGTIGYTIGGTAGSNLTQTTFVDYVKAGTTGKIIFSGGASDTCTITALSVKELDDDADAPTEFYLGLVNDTPVETDQLSDITGEPSTNGYERQLLERNDVGWPTLALDSGDYMASSKQVTFGATGGAWGPVIYAILVDVKSGTSGVLIAFVALSATKTILENETFGCKIKIKLQ